MTTNDWYRIVNSTWPSDAPPISAEEAIRAGRRLYRYVMGAPFNGHVRVTSGRRYSWIRNGVMSVNPDHGWKEIVHSLSHYCHRRLNPGIRPHGEDHAVIERGMILKVIESGWLSGSLKSTPKIQPSSTQIKLMHSRSMLKAWDMKLKRAQTFRKKWERKVSYYENRISI